MLSHAKQQKVRDRQSLTLLTSKCASRHNGVHFFIISTSNSGLGPSVSYTFDFEMCFAPQGRAVQFFISHLPRWLHTRRFSEPTFSTLQSHKSLEKHSVSRLCYLFAHPHLLSSDSFCSLIFFLLLFSFLTLPTSAFSSVHIVGSLTSKLLSISIYYCNANMIFS